MVKVSNETKLVIELAKERMSEQLRDWLERSSNPSASSSSPRWLLGYEHANRVWLATLDIIITDLEKTKEGNHGD